MIDELIRQLNDADPAIRRRAIVALGKSKDVSALPALATVVRNDPDADLRDLAKKAGQYIRRESEKQTQPRSDESPDTAPLPNTADLITKTPSKPTPSATPSQPPASRLRLLGDDALPKPSPPAQTPPPSSPPASRLRLLGSEKEAPPKAPDESRFQRPVPVDDEPILDLGGYPDEPILDLDIEDAPEPDTSRFARPTSDVYEPPIDLYERLATGNRTAEPSPESAVSSPPEPPLDPDIFGEAPLPDLLPGEPREPEAPKAPLIVKGREYNVTRDERIRAKEYLDAALSQNIRGDNAKAMKSLTQAISLNPNLINDGFFNNVASAVTGLYGDEATQMVIDRQQRKRFTEIAAQQQKNERVEKHLTEAKQTTSTDVWWEVILYSLIVIIGPVIVMIVTIEGSKNLLNNFAEVSAQLPEGFQDAQAVFASFSLATLFPIAIVSGISGVISLLIQTVLIHYSSKALGGTGTWQHLVQVLLGFYNRWLPFIFLLLSGVLFFTLWSQFSPVSLCFVLVLIILSLYVSVKTASKIGEAYDFGAAMGCMALLISLLVIGVINMAISFVMAQTLGFALSGIIG